MEEREERGVRGHVRLLEHDAGRESLKRRQKIPNDNVAVKRGEKDGCSEADAWRRSQLLVGRRAGEMRTRGAAGDKSSSSSQGGKVGAVDSEGFHLSSRVSRRKEQNEPTKLRVGYRIGYCHPSSLPEDLCCFARILIKVASPRLSPPCSTANPGSPRPAAPFRSSDPLAAVKLVRRLLLIFLISSSLLLYFTALRDTVFVGWKPHRRLLAFQRLHLLSRVQSFAERRPEVEIILRSLRGAPASVRTTKCGRSGAKFGEGRGGVRPNA